MQPVISPAEASARIAERTVRLRMGCMVLGVDRLVGWMMKFWWNWKMEELMAVELVAVRIQRRW